MAQRQGSSNAVAGSILLVVHDFIARSPDELSLAKGDRIELFERCALYPVLRQQARHIGAFHSASHGGVVVRGNKMDEYGLIWTGTNDAA